MLVAQNTAQLSRQSLHVIAQLSRTHFRHICVEPPLAVQRWFHTGRSAHDPLRTYISQVYEL